MSNMIPPRGMRYVAFTHHKRWAVSEDDKNKTFEEHQNDNGA